MGPPPKSLIGGVLIGGGGIFPLKNDYENYEKKSTPPRGPYRGVQYILLPRGVAPLPWAFDLDLVWASYPHAGGRGTQADRLLRVNGSRKSFRRRCGECGSLQTPPKNALILRHTV